MTEYSPLPAYYLISWQRGIFGFMNGNRYIIVIFMNWVMSASFEIMLAYGCTPRNCLFRD